MKPPVVLFDIDETLVHTGGSGARSWDAAFRKLYDTPADIGQHTSSGETDPQVARETFKGVLGREPTTDELAKIYAQYLLHIADDIWTSEKYQVLPGAEQTLIDLSNAGIILGIVSGAMEGAARTKLSPGDLNRYFLFGGYGSDSADRAVVTQGAIERARELHDQLRSNDVYIVGDTPHDVEATHAVGAVSIGVASGNYSVKDLQNAGADFVLHSLEDPFPGLSD